MKRYQFGEWEIDDDGWWWLYTTPGRDTAAWVRPDGDAWRWSVFSPWSSEEWDTGSAPTLDVAQDTALGALERYWP